MGKVIPVASALERNMDNLEAYSARIPSQGWVPCPLRTNISRPYENGTSTPGYRVECNIYTVPLCYKGYPGFPDGNVCSSNLTIEAFVKRIVANYTVDPYLSRRNKQQAFWISEGGPGFGMEDVEELMRRSFIALNGTWSVYSMDHRGTGRSHRLTCNDTRTDLLDGANATQLFADCIGRYQKTYGQENAAGFSVTSAAMDLSTLSRHIEPNADWFMYGLSYATFLLERLMHLQPQHVRGYILDAVVPETMVLPNGDHEYGKISSRVLAECDKWPACTAKFGNVSLATFLGQFYKDIETEPRLAYCRNWLHATALRPYEPVSWAARKLFASMIGSYRRPRLMPVMLLLLSRCDPKDYPALQAAATYAKANQLGDANDVDNTFDSIILYQLMLASERALFHSPPPSLDAMRQYFVKELVVEGTYRDFQSYCFFTGSHDAVCKAQKYPETGHGFVYAPDSYHDKVARIPRHASLLMLNGNLDPITPDSQAKFQFDQYKSPHKLYVNVTTAAHSTSAYACGFEIIISYLEQAGHVHNVNTSCLASIPPFFAVDVSEKGREMFNSTDDLIPTKNEL
ncbi:Aste57867_3534 [Aphanomyces stellatus]|uniref:Aste57867_3534 protein n=1 Tax=Aphanomyces stellatus TaxID=120398 RepID=A0A485KDT7_9STRA|nr:hypothetical protein As57867_003523 [Aphanomyces stellatus]VFT80697.1 Aste57867_3534 [Aphanomyces stellatus]